MGLTRSGVAYDFKISPYSYEVNYGIHTVTYVFSSDLYRKNFVSRLEENREKINQSLSNRFGFDIKISKLCDLKLYLSIEKRGFLIYADGKPIECLSDITLDGNSLIMKH